jgi:hypothetical protein
MLGARLPDGNGGVCTSGSNDFGVDLTLTTAWTQFTISLASNRLRTCGVARRFDC